MADRHLELQLTWNDLTREELPELSGLLTAIEHLDDPMERHSLESLTEDFDDAVADDGLQAVLVRDLGGALVAYGWNHVSATDVDPRRVYLMGGVHPGWRRQGIGHAVLDWQLKHAKEWDARTRQPGFGPLRQIVYVDEKLKANGILCESFGLQPVRWYADMSFELSQPLPEIKELSGISIVAYSDEYSEGVRLAHNEAFADHWGSQEVDQVRWARELARSAARPHWSWVALDDATGEVVGYAMNSAYEQDWTAQGFSEGWTDRLGVRRDWRSRGVAQALLVASMKSFLSADLDAAGLGVDSDNPSGAFAIYEHLGYVAGEMVVMYARDEKG